MARARVARTGSPPTWVPLIMSRICDRAGAEEDRCRQREVPGCTRRGRTARACRSGRARRQPARRSRPTIPAAMPRRAGSASGAAPGASLRPGWVILASARRTRPETPNASRESPASFHDVMAQPPSTAIALARQVWCARRRPAPSRKRRPPPPPPPRSSLREGPRRRTREGDPRPRQDPTFSPAWLRRLARSWPRVLVPPGRSCRPPHDRLYSGGEPPPMGPRLPPARPPPCRSARTLAPRPSASAHELASSPEPSSRSRRVDRALGQVEGALAALPERHDDRVAVSGSRREIEVPRSPRSRAMHRHAMPSKTRCQPGRPGQGARRSRQSAPIGHQGHEQASSWRAEPAGSRPAVRRGRA